jgi:sigma-B regulation protein RsbU (phosphoserine phosphatase)
MDVFEALETAIRSEAKTQKVYDKLAEEVSDVAVKSLFNYLAEIEFGHHQFLESKFRDLAAAREDRRNNPSNRSGQPAEETQAVPEGAAASNEAIAIDPEQYRLNLSISENMTKTLQSANAKLLQNQIRYEQELAIAADIQKKLLPRELPQYPDMQIAASNVMARSVGGDYYDFSVNQQGQLALVVADSMGKGIPAALLMTTIRATWRSCLASVSSSPGRTLEAINQAVYSDLKVNEAFVTMVAAMYDPVTSFFRYSNAGHNPPIFRPELAPRCEELDVGSTPIGIFPDTSFPGGEFLIREGDVVVIYTDGVVEATDGDNALFGFDRLCGVVEQNHKLSAEDIKSAILAEVSSFTGNVPQMDDITLVVLKKL